MSNFISQNVTVTTGNGNVTPFHSKHNLVYSVLEIQVFFLSFTQTKALFVLHAEERNGEQRLLVFHSPCNYPAKTLHRLYARIAAAQNLLFTVLSLQRAL
jgi:hypothetical protein